VLQGLQGKPVAEFPSQHQISQPLDYQGRDQFRFRAHPDTAFAAHQHPRKAAHTKPENANLKTLVGELPLDLKDSAELRC
jgi:hypothetical protein